MSEFEDKLKIEALFRDAFTIFSKLAASFLAIFLIYFMADMMLQNLFGVDPLDMFKASAHTGWYVAFLFLISTAFSGIITASSWSFMTGAAHPVQNGIRRVMQIFPVLLVAAALSGLAVVFGLLLLIVPGVVVALALTLVTQVMVVENPGPMAALQRSYELTNGHKMQIFFIMLMFLARYGYFLIQELGPRGATWGKRITGIRIAARDGGRLTAEAVIARNLLRDIELFMPLVFLMVAPSGDMGSAGLAGLAWFMLFMAIAGVLSLDLRRRVSDPGLRFSESSSLVSHALSLIEEKPQHTSKIAGRVFGLQALSSAG